MLGSGDFHLRPGQFGTSTRDLILECSGLDVSNDLVTYSHFVDILSKYNKKFQSNDNPTTVQRQSNDSPTSVQRQSNDSPMTVQQQSNDSPTTVQRQSNYYQMTVERQPNVLKSLVMQLYKTGPILNCNDMRVL
jgi:hypothetical protein